MVAFGPKNDHMIKINRPQRPPKAIRQLGYLGHQEANIYVEYKPTQAVNMRHIKSQYLLRPETSVQNLIFSILLHKHSMASEQPPNDF